MLKNLHCIFYLHIFAQVNRDNMAKQLGIPVRYDNKLELARKFLRILFTINPPNIKHWVEKASEALAYFLAYGYSKENENLLQQCLSDNITKNYARVLVHMLKKNGYIVIDKKTHTKRLSDEMLRCREQIFIKNERVISIGFIKNEKR